MLKILGIQEIPLVEPLCNYLTLKFIKHETKRSSYHAYVFCSVVRAGSNQFRVTRPKKLFTQKVGWV